VPRYAAFLRAVNLGRNRRVSGAELQALFADDLGLAEVSTFRTSGNVVFEAGREARAALTERIETGLEASLGYPVATFLRTAAELRSLAAAEPFPAEVIDASKGKLQVVFLRGKPGASALELATEEDRIALGPRELFWLPSRGVGGSELDPKALERVAGPATVRTMGTVEQLVAKFFG
jgi:uncharacterized protein (DUF1697 family)